MRFTCVETHGTNSPGVSRSVNSGLRVMLTRWHRFISCHKHPIWWRGVDGVGKILHVCERGQCVLSESVLSDSVTS